MRNDDYEARWLNPDENPEDPWASPPAPAATAPPADYGPPQDWSQPAATGSASTTSGSYASDLGPQTSAASPNDTGVPSSAYNQVGDYQSYLDRLGSAQDPASQAAARDELARTLHQDLEADGHAISWKGDTMMIDGRPYEIGDGTGGAPNLPGGGTFNEKIGGDVTPPTIGSTTTSGPPTGGSLLDASFVDQFLAYWGNQPGVNPSVKTDPGYWKGRFLSGAFGNDQQYAIARMMQPEGPPESGAGPRGAPTPTSFSTFRGLPTAGRPPGSNTMPGNINVSGGPDTGGGPNSFRNTLGQLPDWMQGWKPGASYDPGMIDTSVSDLPGFDELLRLGTAQNPADADLEALVRNLLEHPESLSEQDVEMLKSRNAEEAAAAAQAQDEELLHYGYNTGLDTSPWLAGQRATTAWGRRNATIESNRNVDMAAAERRGADRRSAAQLGTSFASYKSDRQQKAVSLAVEGALGKAGEQRTRAQLNESFKQAAAQLGISKDQLALSYITSNLSFLTQNKAIDTNFNVDMKKLNEQSDQFKQTLAQRIAEVKQSDDQFRAQYGLDAQRLQQLKDQDAWERAKTTYGLK